MLRAEIAALKQSEAQSKWSWQLDATMEAYYSSCVDVFFREFHGQPVLLFHERQFRRDFAHRSLANELLWAVMGQATFLTDAKLDPLGHNEQYYVTRAWHAVCHALARQSTSLSTVQALLIVTDHQFITGRLDASSHALNLALSLARGMDLFSEVENGHKNDRKDDAKTRQWHESRRRVAWSTYLYNVIFHRGGNKFLNASLTDHDVSSIRLPMSEHDFQHGFASTAPRLRELKSSQLSFNGIMIRVFRLWSYINQSDPETRPLTLASLLDEFEASAPQMFHTRPHAIGEMGAFIGQWIYTRIVYHAAYCCIHHPVQAPKAHAYQTKEEQMLMELMNNSVVSTSQNSSKHQALLHARELAHLVRCLHESTYRMRSAWLSYCVAIAVTVLVIAGGEEQSIENCMLFMTEVSKCWPVSATLSLHIWSLQRASADRDEAAVRTEALAILDYVQISAQT